MTATKEHRKAKVTDEHKEEARKLKELWDTRMHETQQLFGERYGIGGQSAVGQFIRGEVPLSLGAAKGFAEGLKCQISDFSPRLAKLAAELGIVSGTDEKDLTKLRRDELHLIQLYRMLPPEKRDELQLHANDLYSDENPAPSAANPFGKKPPPR
jgi:hypothetical protein